jgi:hypothetical protein
LRLKAGSGFYALSTPVMVIIARSYKTTLGVPEPNETTINFISEVHNGNFTKRTL